MKLTKILIGMCMLVILSSIAFAGACFTGQTCYVYHDVEDATYDQVFVNITDDNGAYVNSGNMTNQEANLYYFPQVFDTAGNYSAFIVVYNDSVQQSNTTYDFEIRDDTNLYLFTCPSSERALNTLMLIGAIIVAFIIFSIVAQQPFIGIIASIGTLYVAGVLVGCNEWLGMMITCGALLMFWAFGNAISN